MITIPMNNTSQDQIVKVLIGGIKYKFRFTWNRTTMMWSTTIYMRDELIIAGKMLASGVELFNQYNIPLTHLYAINLDDNTNDLSGSLTGVSSKLVMMSEQDITDITNKL